MILLRSFLSGHIRIKRTLEYYDAGIGPRVPFGGGFGPTVSANFAVALGDYSTLSTTSSMPTGGLITRAGNAMLYDSTGKLTWAPNNMVLSSSNLGSATYWVSAKQGIGLDAVLTANYAADPFGGNTAARWQMDLNGGTTTNDRSRVTSVSAIPVAVSTTYILSMWIRSNTTSNYTIRFQTGGVGTFVDITVTPTWQRFSYSGVSVVSASSPFFGLLGGLGLSSTADILVYGIQLEAVTYQTTPSTYVATTSAAYYGPRFDYDPATLAAKGLLVEGSRTNLLTYSQDFRDTATAGSTRPWTWTRATVSSNTSGTIAPDGTSTASKLIEDTTPSATHTVYQTVSSTAGTAYTFSVYAKAAERTQINIGLFDGTLNISAYFNLSTGTYISSTGSPTAYSITNVGNGWYRVSLTGTTTPSTGTSLSGYLYPAVSGAIAYTGDGTSGVYIFGAQVELGAFATSYTPTVASSVARAAETFTLANYQNRLVESFYIDEQTGGSWSANINASATSPLTISTPTFGWVTSLRAYTNAYAGDITTPSWIDNSGTTGNRMYYDSTGALTWATANLLTYSEQFDNGAWTKTNSSITANAVIAPDGTVTADKLVENTATASHFVNSNVTVANTATYTYSVYAKAAERSYLTIYAINTGAAANTFFNLSTGTVVSTSSGATSAIVSVGNGWYRCSITATTTSTTSGIYPGISADGVNASYTGNGTSGIYIWGAQLEPVTYQTQPRAYIPTTSAAVYQPRYDYDPSVTPATPRGMLIEESRVNLNPYSQQFDGGSWTRNNILAFGSGSIANAVTAPDGTTTGYKITPNTTGAVAHSIYYNSVTLAAVTYAFSIYAKPAGYNWIKLGNLSTGGGVNFNLSTGAVGAASSGYSGSTTYVGNGWYRCIVIWTATAGSITPGFYIATADNNVVFAGDGTSGVYAWGMQIEAGSFATSYIPTTTASVTRVADVVKLSGSALTTLQGSAFSVGLEATTGIPAASINQQLLLGGLYSGTQAYLFMNTNTTAGSYDPSSSPTPSATATTGSGGWATTSRVALSNASSGRSLVMNNGSVQSASPFVQARTVVQLGAYSGLSTAFLCGWFRSFAAYNQKLPDAILKQKSTVGAPY